jgi:PAS domain S-box-containing protein
LTTDSTSNRDMLRPLRRILGRAGDASGPDEDALRESEQRFRYMVQNSSDIITLLGADGTVFYVSPAIERVLGYSPEERIGENTFDLVHPDDAARARRAFAESLRSPGVTLALGVRMRHRDGRWRHMEITGTNRLDDPGVDAIVLNSRDVTERERAEKALKESERRYADLLSNTRAYVYRCLNEPGWPNEFASDYALELTGYAPEDLLVGGTVRFGDLIVEGQEEASGGEGARARRPGPGSLRGRPEAWRRRAPVRRSRRARRGTARPSPGKRRGRGALPGASARCGWPPCPAR